MCEAILHSHACVLLESRGQICYRAMLLLVSAATQATPLRTITALRSDLGNWIGRPYPSTQCSRSHFAHYNASGVVPLSTGSAIPGCYHGDSGYAHDSTTGRVFVPVRWNATTDLGDKDSPTHLVAVDARTGRLSSISKRPLAHIPWALAYDSSTSRLLGVWVAPDPSSNRSRHVVVSIDAQSGAHTELLALPTDPYCTTQHDGDCHLASARYGKAMLDVTHRRWILPMSSALAWNLTLVHVDIDAWSVSHEVRVADVGYNLLYATVTNTALDVRRQRVVALLGKRTGLFTEQSWLVSIDPQSGAVDEVTNQTGIAWTTGSGNSVYDEADGVLYYVLADVAQDQPVRTVVALPVAAGAAPMQRMDVGSTLPPDCLWFA